MRTDDLIVRLAREARPIRPLPPPGLRAVRWLLAAVVVMIVATALSGPRGDLTAALGQPIFLGSIVALLLTLASGASAAFVLSVPGAERSPVQRLLPVLAAATWTALWLGAWFVTDAPAGPRTAAIHLACALQIAACALAGGWLLLAMIVRAAPMRPLWTAAVAGLASMAVGALVAQLFCPLDDERHQLVGHVSIAVMVAGTCLLAGRLAINRNRDSGFVA